MGINYKVVKDDLPKMEKSLNFLSNKKVNVGYLEASEQAWLAGIHEYGCTIIVTPAMRAWLHAHGLHLKPTTTTIVIPERSFLRTGFDTYHEDVVKQAEKALSKSLIDGDIEKVLDAIGLLLRDKIVDYAIDLKTPPKHPFSLQMNPGKTNPLIISGDMVDAISYEVK